MAEDTIMVLKVNLGCARCYKKIKKLLCKFPEIRDQAFIEKEDTVIIKVVCCSPERIRSKLICKGGKTIQSIEIKVPQKPPAPPKKPTPIPKEEPERPQLKPPPEKKVKETKDQPKKDENPYQQFYPVAVCCKPCFDMGHGGPCHHGYGNPYQPPSSYDGYVRLMPSNDESYGSWPSGCRCNRSHGCRCEYFAEENPACAIM